MIGGLKLVTVVLLGSLALVACGSPAATPPSSPTATTATPAPTTTPITPLAISPSPPTPTMPSPTPTAISSDIRDLFLANCSGCHGAKRQGVRDLGPALTPAAVASLSDADVKQTITDGRKDTLMPAWKGTLSEAEIASLVQFLKHNEP